MVANNGKRGRTFSVLLETHINLFFSMSHIVVFAEKMKSRMAYRNIAPGVTLIHILCIHKNLKVSCVYTSDLLCMQDTLVHALGQCPKRALGPAQGPGHALFEPWPRGSLAQSMQKWCACTRDFLCIHKGFFLYTQEMYSHIIIIYY